MAILDFIAAKEFRESLEGDYSELEKSFNAQAWKSVQVIAGSIVEALLIDYFLSTKNDTRPKKDPLKLDLGEAIAMAKAEDALSERTSDLCSVIRSYRNLIHPGRMVRLKEPSPDQGSASIAKALVDIILEELSKSRRASIGLSAEQLISKILRDSNSLTILKHLISEVSEHQKEKLLLELIPRAYQEIYENGPLSDSFSDYENKIERLEAAYKAIFDSVSIEAKVRVVNDFVRILREEDGDVVTRYSAAFFRFSELKLVQPQHLEMVREHLFDRIPSTHSTASLKLMDGIQTVLKEADILKWLDPYVRAVISNSSNSVEKQKIRDHLMFSADLLDESLEESIDRRLDDWIRHFDKLETPDRAAIVRELKEDLNSQRIPF